MRNSEKHQSPEPINGKAKTLYKLLRKIGNGLAMQYDEKTESKRQQRKH